MDFSRSAHSTDPACANFFKNSLCYAHAAGLPWTYGLKSIYFSSRGVTQEVHLYFLIDAHTWSPPLDMLLEIYILLYPKSLPKSHPKPSRTPPPATPNRSKRALGGNLDPIWDQCLKKARPRGAQERPRGAQECTKRCPRGPRATQRHPRATWTPPKWSSGGLFFTCFSFCDAFIGWNRVLKWFVAFFHRFLQISNRFGESVRFVFCLFFVFVLKIAILWILAFSLGKN